MEKILLTGASGFLGGLIQRFLPANYTTIGRSGADIGCDVSMDVPRLTSAIGTVIHSAGKAHLVPKKEIDKQAFFDVNVKGTENLLKGLERLPSLPGSFVFISSVAVYGVDEGMGINEGFPLNAKDPYGLSKIQAEHVVQEWCAKNNVICTILRLPLLVGPNPKGNLGTMIKGIEKGFYLNIGNGGARKSMVLAEDVARILLAAKGIGGIYNLTDGDHPSFYQLSAHIARLLHKRPPRSIPMGLARIMAKTGDVIGDKFPFNSYKLSKITAHLTFDDSKAIEKLGWRPTKVLEADFLS